MHKYHQDATPLLCLIVRRPVSKQKYYHKNLQQQLQKINLKGQFSDHMP